MVLFFGIFNLVSYMRDSEDEEIKYEYYESSSLEEDNVKVKVVPVFVRGKKIK